MSNEKEVDIPELTPEQLQRGQRGKYYDHRCATCGRRIHHDGDRNLWFHDEGPGIHMTYCWGLALGPDNKESPKASPAQVKRKKK